MGNGNEGISNYYGCICRPTKGSDGSTVGRFTVNGNELIGDVCTAAIGSNAAQWLADNRVGQSSVAPSPDAAGASRSATQVEGGTVGRVVEAEDAIIVISDDVPVRQGGSCGGVGNIEDDVTGAADEVVAAVSKRNGTTVGYLANYGNRV